MNEDFGKVNNQIASFIVLSAVMVAPVMLPCQSGVAQANTAVMLNNNVVDTATNIMRYAGPINVIDQPVRIDPINAGPIMRYAGPINVIDQPVRIDPINVGPIMRYAGPINKPIKFDPIKAEPINVEPIVRYAGPQMPSADVNINPSASNLNFGGGAYANYGLIKINSGHYIYK